MSVDKTKCDAEVPIKGMSFYRTQKCGRPAKFNGKCGVHSSEAIKEREEKRDAKWKARHDRVNAMQTRQNQRKEFSTETVVALQQIREQCQLAQLALLQSNTTAARVAVAHIEALVSPLLEKIVGANGIPS